MKYIRNNDRLLLNVSNYNILNFASDLDYKNTSCEVSLSYLSIQTYLLNHCRLLTIYGALLLKPKQSPGGALTLEMGTGMCRNHDPLFSGQSALPSLPIYHQCAAHEHPIFKFRKILHFQPCFGQNFSSQDANFPNFRSQDPAFFKENPLPRPYFWKPVWRTSTKKKKLSAPPGTIHIPFNDSLSLRKVKQHQQKQHTWQSVSPLSQPLPAAGAGCVGHAGKPSQGCDSVPSPTHWSPPLLGTGLSHSRVLTRDDDTPHVSEHSLYAPQAPHPPFTVVKTKI